jgi:hypothetical protein
LLSLAVVLAANPAALAADDVARQVVAGQENGELSLALAKRFDDPVDKGATVELEFAILNSTFFALSGIEFTDDLDATLSGLEAIDTPKTGICGPGSQITGTSSLSFTGGSLDFGDICTFTVTLLVPIDAQAGDHLNTTSTITGDGPEGIEETGDPATDTLDVNNEVIPALGGAGALALALLLGGALGIRTRRRS